MEVSRIPVTINNRQYNVRANASILQACEEALIEVPRFCYHEKLSVAGNCRMCLVEVEKSPKPVVSCAMPVSKGMVIYTDTPLVKKARESVLEFLLINHPLDCPICDQGGECDLQDETLQYGSDRGRFYEFKRSVEDKECGPIVKTIMTRCIHCTRCVRFSAEIAGQETLGAFGRGQDTEIGTYVQSFIRTELSGNLVDLCPVGALTSKPYAFMARSWELQRRDTIDTFDGLCADITVQTRKLSTPEIRKGKVELTSKEEIVRIIPRFNGLYQDNWISDKTRYAFDGLRNQRVNNVLRIDRNELGKQSSIDWIKASTILLDKLIGSAYHFMSIPLNPYVGKSRMALIVDSQIDLEGLYVLNQFIKMYGGIDIQKGSYKNNCNIDIPSFFLFNRSFNELDQLNSLVIIGANPRFEASILNTVLRKEQLSRALSYYTYSSPSSLRLRHSHESNSLRGLIALIENRSNNANKLLVTENTSILFGAETLKVKGGTVLQNIVRFLGKKLITKTKKGERLGILQNNTTSLLFSYLGVAAGVRSILHSDENRDKKIDLLFAVQPFTLTNKKWLSTKKYTHVVAFSTHKPQNLSYDMLLPIKSVYEKNGFFVNIEGRLRKSYKAVTAPSNARSFDGIVSSLLRLRLNPNNEAWTNTLESFWKFEDEISPSISFEKVNAPYFFNIFAIKEDGFKTALIPFTPNVINFYMTDLVSQNSPVMGECVLFLNKEDNFIKEF